MKKGVYIFKRSFLFLLVCYSQLSIFAATISNGGVNYSLTAQALSNMTQEVLVTMGYVVSVLYAIASILAIYCATSIYVKMQTGEGGIVKSILMLFGSILFLIGATMVLPAFFGFGEI